MLSFVEEGLLKKGKEGKRERENLLTCIMYENAKSILNDHTILFLLEGRLGGGVKDSNMT